MSAYICTKETFIKLAAFAAVNKLIDADADADADADIVKAFASIANCLQEENYKSVNYCYGKNNKTKAIPTQSIQSIVEAAQLERNEILRLVDELEYQSCEHKEWTSSLACSLLKEIKTNAIALKAPNDTSVAPEGSLLGKPLSRNGSIGFIVNEGSSNQQTYTIGARGVQKNSTDTVDIIWLPTGYSEMKNLYSSIERVNRIQKHLQEAEQYNMFSITPRQCQTLLEDYQGECKRLQDDAAEREKARKNQRERFNEQITKIMPEDCKGVIIAEYLQNDSDPYEDYHTSSTSRTLILGFSKHNRDLFPEMRKAIKSADLEDLPEVQMLADTDKGEERREKYSMGKGFYINEKGTCTYSGWQVKKISVYNKKITFTADQVPVGEIRLPKKGSSTPTNKKTKASSDADFKANNNSIKQDIEPADKIEDTKSPANHSQECEIKAAINSGTIGQLLQQSHSVCSFSTNSEPSAKSISIKSSSLKPISIKQISNKLIRIEAHDNGDISIVFAGCWIKFWKNKPETPPRPQENKMTSINRDDQEKSSKADVITFPSAKATISKNIDSKSIAAATVYNFKHATSSKFCKVSIIVTRFGVHHTDSFKLVNSDTHDLPLLNQYGSPVLDNQNNQRTISRSEILFSEHRLTDDALIIQGINYLNGIDSMSIEQLSFSWSFRRAWGPYTKAFSYLTEAINQLYIKSHKQKQSQ